MTVILTPQFRYIIIDKRNLGFDSDKLLLEHVFVLLVR